MSFKCNQYSILVISSIPITARLGFLKYLFFNGGFILDIEAGSGSTLDDQTGLGVIFGVGAKYTIDNGVGAFINGYYKHHAVIPFAANLDEYRWRVLEGGLRIWVTYDF